MVPDIIIAAIIILSTLITVLKKSTETSEYMFNYVVLILILTLLCVGPHRAILLGMSISPLIYLLYLLQANKTKNQVAQSTTIEKVLLYFSMAPLFGFLFFDFELKFLKELDFTLSDFAYLPEFFLIFLSIVTFIELIKFKRGRDDS